MGSAESRETILPQGVVDRSGEIVTRIDQGAVEIEEKDVAASKHIRQSLARTPRNEQTKLVFLLSMGRRKISRNYWTHIIVFDIQTNV